MFKELSVLFLILTNILIYMIDSIFCIMKELKTEWSNISVRMRCLRCLSAVLSVLSS